MDEILKLNTATKRTSMSGTSSEESEDEMKPFMLEAKALLRSMYEASKKEPNINKTLKDGLPVLVNILESMAGNRYSGFFARCRVAEVCGETADIC